MLNDTLTSKVPNMSAYAERKTFHWSLVVAGSVSLALNSIFAIMFMKFHKKLLRHNNNKILLSMTLADSLVGIFCILLAATLMTNQKQVVYKMVGVIPLFGSMFTSIFSIGIMTLDRLIAIKLPLRHKSLLSGKRIVKLLCLTWILPGLVTVQEIVVYLHYSWMVELKIRGYILFGFFAVGATFLFTSNVYLYITIRDHAKYLNELILVSEGRQRLFSDLSTNNGADGIYECMKSLKSCRKSIKYAKSLLKEINAAKLCIKIAVLFVALWVPLVSYRMSYTVGYRIGIPWLRRLCLFMAVINSAMNPVLYLMTRSGFQKFLLQLFMLSHTYSLKPKVLNEKNSETMGKML